MSDAHDMPTTPDPTGGETTKQLYGLLAEFEDVNDFALAAERVRDAGYGKWDCHSPFPVHGLDGAMGIRSTILPYLVFGAAVTGAGLAMLMQWWMNAVDYPIIISGKPLFSIPANIPVTFELTILFGALTAFVGMLALNGLPQPYHPLFASERFRRATQDRFFIAIEAGDPKFDLEQTRALLTSLGSEVVEEVWD